MFNVGILAGRVEQSAVASFDFEIPVAHVDTNFLFTRQGSTSYVAGSQTLPGPPWYMRANVANPGDSFQYRATLEAGSATQIGGSFGVWSLLSSNRGTYFGDFIGGRVLVEIRDIASQNIQGSCRIWRGPFAP